jgi:hypothetical protein
MVRVGFVVRLTAVVAPFSTVRVRMSAPLVLVPLVGGALSEGCRQRRRSRSSPNTSSHASASANDGRWTIPESRAEAGSGHRAAALRRQEVLQALEIAPSHGSMPKVTRSW